MAATTDARALLDLAVAAADATGGEDLVALDVSEPLPFADIFLIASGNSERNVIAIADAIEETLLDGGRKPVRREGASAGRWILLDFGDLVVHIFHEQERTYYSLERLWKECPALPVNEAASDSSPLPASTTDA